MANIAVLYTMTGCLFGLMSWNARNRWGTFLIVVSVWPWLVYIEGTPRMRKFKAWVQHG